jgi:transcriptional regulator with XRE-family HTH domain
MKRESIIRSKGYNLAKIQNELFNQVNEYLESTGKSRVDFAKDLGVSKGYVSQVLNGDFDFRLSKLIELSLAIGKVPSINFTEIKGKKNNEETKVVKLHEYQMNLSKTVDKHVNREAFVYSEVVYK